MQVFAEQGFDGASVEAICERAGFTRGAFYSNFGSKDELFLELTSLRAEEKLAAVRTRIVELTEAGQISPDADPVAMVQGVLESGEDDRLSVLMMSETRLHALRDPEFAVAFTAHEHALLASVEAIIVGIVETGSFTLRLDVAVAARMLMTVWEGAAIRSAISGADGNDLQCMGGEALGPLVELIIAPTPSGE